MSKKRSCDAIDNNHDNKNKRFRKESSAKANIRKNNKLQDIV